jgi:C-terminal processing protease CtpA/Prc
MALSLTQREDIFDRTYRTVQKNYFDPTFNGRDWPNIAAAKKASILKSQDAEEFENLMHQLVRELGTSHTGFFHQDLRRVPGRLAISATFRKHQTSDGLRWMFQDVHEGGPAHAAGIEPTDVLIEINRQTVVPPDQPSFPMAGASSLTVLKRDGRQANMNIAIPKPRWRKQPFAEPLTVSFAELDDRLAYLKTTIAPGLVGIDIAREFDNAVAKFANCDRLILDLRGFLGGGLGVLRLMSYMTPGKIPIGYSVTRRRAERGYRKETLPHFERLPSSKFTIPLLALRYLGRDESVVLFSEGLGPRKFQGRIILLANEHTASAGEIVCAFAAENKLARIVGNQTAGRLLGGKGYRVGFGYVVILPAAAFLTWEGNSYEGHGIKPDVSVDWSPEAYREGRDNQLEKAIELAKELP